jgi:hypothetical protein
VDQFTFSIEDSGWSTYTLQVELRSIPEDATYRLTVEDSGGEQLYQDFGSDSLTAELGDGWFEDGSGTYRAIVEAIAGADCSSSYLLTLSVE